MPKPPYRKGVTRCTAAVLDVFNEFNVQIMSPNFVLQPKEPVVVAKENWYAAPAAAPEEINKKEG
ncbi:Uncharacterised protein [Raoultella terrigena]|uniref:Uncharacterized protein n=1 Tax=Raoultella terrigena TaxID=577 RepID=A0A4U9CZZ6_RAOTE|nr:Uncharacterised protein [Raoultella terrigena]